jgi:hypothetical protein
VIYFSFFEETFMKHEQIKAEILQAFSKELDELFEDADKIEGTCDYEERYLQFARNINGMILQKSVGEIPESRFTRNSVVF